MQPDYIVRTVHDEAAVKAMSKANYNLYHPQTKVTIYAIGFSLILIGFFWSSLSSSLLPIGLLMIGCWVFVCGEYPARQSAREILKQMNGAFPTVEFRFQQANFVVRTSKDSGIASYDDIRRLGENKDYYFLFRGDRNAYIISKRDFSKGSSSEFKDFIEEKTDCKTEPITGGLKATLIHAPFRRRK